MPTGALSTPRRLHPQLAGRACIPGVDALNWADATGGGDPGRRGWSCAAPARADDGRLDWPLRPRPAVMRAFDAPSPNWNRGHRGVDLAGSAGPAGVCRRRRAPWCSPGSWPAGRWCRWPTRAVCAPATSRCGRGAGRAAGGVGHGDRRAGGRTRRAARRRRACTGARCGVPPRAPTTSTRSGCW